MVGFRQAGLTYGVTSLNRKRPYANDPVHELPAPAVQP